MEAILYFDLLGARSRWRADGATGAKAAFDSFAALTIAAARPDMADVLDGGIETDSAALVCRDAAVGVRIAGRAFRSAFFQRNNNYRTWIRGSLVPWDGQALRSSRPARAYAEHFSIFTYSGSMFDAIAVEKSGFKGMRLLVRSPLVTAALRSEFRIRIGLLSMLLFRNLRHSSYPKMLDKNVVDYLWMCSDEEKVRRDFAFQMAQRLREANFDAEEFVQAAATQVVFHEADAIYHSIAHRAPAYAEEMRRRGR